ncbi:MAG: CoB--CoM heterodisulfide reductase iron-sulfur subunit A family protein [Clostridia bacterium]|nr:CoB--CoM heterodisulfide reductase iron-sulfur subunit A family protein [Clostridia bacterium]
MNENLKIGVFLCKCGGALAKRIDFQKLLTQVNTFPGVSYSQVDSALCLAEGRVSIGRAIKEQGLNRVVIAGCSPSFHEETFMEALRDFGFDPQLMAMAALRERCFGEEATQRAAREVLAAVRKAALLVPLPEKAVSVEPAVAIIGGGLTGIEAALTAAQLGLRVTLIEKEKELGRRGSELYPEVLTKKLQELVQQPRITVSTGTELLAIKGQAGHFAISVKKGGQTSIVNAGAIIIASGVEPQTPPYFSPPQVIGLWQLPRILATSSEKFRRVGFLVDLAQESRLASHMAVEGALACKKNWASEAYILCRNVKVDGREWEGLYRQARDQGVIFFKFRDNPSVKLCGVQVEIVVNDIYLGGQPVSLACDLLVVEQELAVGPSIREIAREAGLTISPEGWLQDANVHLYPVLSNRPGIFYAGLCRWEQELEESLADARQAAESAASLLSGGKTWVLSGKVAIEAEKCALCLTCIRSCPHRAISIDPIRRAPYVDDLSCQGCGICAAECPGKALQLNGFTDAQMAVQLQLGEGWK